MKKRNYISVILVLGMILLFSSHIIAGPNENAGIRFDLDATTYGNQNQTGIDPPSVGAYIRLDVYAVNVNNLDTYEFEINYNQTQLSFIGASATNPLTFEQNILTSDGGTAISFMVDTSTPGVLNIAYTLTGTDPTQAPEGDGLIADVAFQAQTAEQGSLTFGQIKYYDSFGVMDIITDKDVATLPVTLSSFKVRYLNYTSTLYWVTQSETDNIGWNVYRNTEENFSSAQVITNELIPGNGTTIEESYYNYNDNDNTFEIGKTYWYWLESIDLGGITHYYNALSITIPNSDNEPSNIEPPVVYVLDTAPNPMNTSTYFCFTLDRSVESTISIYNIKGELVRTLPRVWVNADEEATIYWNGKDENGNILRSGMYLYTLQVNGNTYKSNKLIITR